jgi:hypothetical protein
MARGELVITCTVCRGQYRPTQRDGSTYAHACPPLSDVELKAAHGWPADDAALTVAQQRELATADRTRPGAVNLNAPAPDELAARIAAAIDTSDPDYLRKANALRAAATISPAPDAVDLSPAAPPSIGVA